MGVALAALLAAPLAEASFLSGDALATAANYIAVFVIIVVPIAVIVIFWLVHILPEKIAHKRHHPQRDAIQVLCLLSLVFGGLLWPLAWLWAYTKPVLHKMAYGTDKHDDYYLEHGATAAGRPVQDEVAALRVEIDRLAGRSDAPRELEAIRDRLAALEPRLAGPAGEAR
jgi:CBS domain containing-hemolysin-like protein